MREIKFERITKVRLPFDRRDPDPKKNYGIHGLDVWFILKGPKGAVQYAATFRCYLNQTLEDPFYWNKLKDRGTISGFDVGYHAKEPQYEGQRPMDECELEQPCYYDGSSLCADTWTDEIFVKNVQPEEILWNKLEEEYRLRFEPQQTPIKE